MGPNRIIPIGSKVFTRLCIDIVIKTTLFKKFVGSRFIFTNEGSELTVDYYFSRFDEVISRIDREYVKQNGILITNINLIKFALWFAKKVIEAQLNEQFYFH